MTTTGALVHACMVAQLSSTHHPLVGITLLVDAQYSMALLTPEPGLMSRPAEIMAISAPNRYDPTMISSLLPRCPILN